MAYLPLSTANLPNPVIDPAQDKEPRDYFETFLYAGNGGGLQVGDVIKKPADTTTISNSLIFNSADSAYLSRTPSGTSGGRNKFTYSGWVKISAISTANGFQLLTAPHASNLNGSLLQINSGNKFYAQFRDYSTGTQGAFDAECYSNMLFKDTGVWYHIVFVYDSTETTPADRMKLWVNGVSQTFSSSDTPDASAVQYIGSNNTHYIGRWLGSSHGNTDGYMAEIHFVDGTALTPSSFGNFDANGIWIPKAVTGITYGTNGFYLDFADSSALGDDESGNTNDWTANNFATTDQVSDSPTNSYPTFSGSNKNSGTQLSEGNLEFRNTSGQLHNSAIGTQRLPKQGKWYWEVKVITDSSPATNAIGIVSASYDNTPTPSGAGNFFYNEGLGWYGNTGGLFGSATYGDEVESGSATTFGNNDIIGVEYDADEKTMYFRKNGTLIDYHYVNIKDSAYDFIPATSAYGDLAGNGTRGNIINFGQKTLYGTDGAGTIPTGFSLLTEDNITVNDQNLESPDLVWTKRRDATGGHRLVDSVRGVGKALASHNNDAEYAEVDGVIDFNKNGFTLGSDTDYNTSGADYVAWAWKANGSGVSNTDGSITSTVSANTTSGFSIVKFIGDNDGVNTSKTIGHGLSNPPEVVIIKQTELNAWYVYHKSLGATQVINLDQTVAASTNASVWNNTAPTSDVFTVGWNGGANGDTKTHIAYCFHSVDGFSKFGSYVGGSDPFVYLGFRPAFVCIKTASTTNPWIIQDAARDAYNPSITWLQPNSSTADQSSSTGHPIDFLSNGFKIRGTSSDIDGSGVTYIYMAFAENPFKYSNAR